MGTPGILTLRMSQESMEVSTKMMDYLLEKEQSEKQEAQDLAAKINAIPGLLEIRNAQADLRAWHR